ncbi:MAG: ferrochelatase [Planctomycetaceae bacterium]|jgi:protoporphyrin/coproporphyrin ferrochelatase|nr:ferrochelatase [Planctomycetaceae bacterium]
MPTDNSICYDAVLFVSFGGPEGPDDVIPFLENVLRGKHVPQERMLEVAEHYYKFDGVSPINSQNRALIKAVESELSQQQINLPVYWGNRNWHPMLTETFEQMQQDSVKRALVFTTSAYSSYSGCRQYRENIEAAKSTLSGNIPETDKIRVFYNHPGFVNTIVDLLNESLSAFDDAERSKATILFTAHSIPNSMADNCAYATQLNETAKLVMNQIGENPWHLVYQSRSGPPSQPWLEPDICDFIEDLAQRETPNHLAIVPIGFISDHMEVMFDLDIEAKAACEELGIKAVRVPTVGTNPQFVKMIVELIRERTEAIEPKALGTFGPSHDVCPMDCCLYTPKRPSTGRP